MNNMIIILLFISSSFLLCSASSQSTVKTLPGFSGNLPFKLETGYVSVGDQDQIELFYYFIESERNPKEDPLILWLTGGPGCSGLCGLAFELDSPVGTGFSYATQENSYYTSDTSSAKYTDRFMRKWLLNHPVFIKNDLYIAGDSYGAKIASIVVHEILNGNEAGLEPQMSLQGYLVGNPITDENDTNERIPYAHGMALISTEYYDSAQRSCHGRYVNPDPNNAQCLRDLELINECLSNINIFHILEASCSSLIGGKKRGVVFLEEDDWQDFQISSDQQKKSICRNDMNYMVSYAWANDPEVRDALHVRKGTIKEWKKCNSLTPVYDENVASAVPYHLLLTRKISKAMVYSGDHDLGVPYIATLKWIQYLNLTVDDDWRPWNVNGQVAGYTQKYKKNEFYLTFATVKGAGHTVPEYKPEQSLAMVDRWISSIPL